MPMVDLIKMISQVEIFNIIYIERKNLKPTLYLRCINVYVHVVYELFLQDCGTDFNATHADVYPNGSLFEDTANVSCIAGYRIVNSSDNSDTFEQIHCQSSGLWSTTYGCEKKGIYWRFI